LGDKEMNVIVVWKSKYVDLQPLAVYSTLERMRDDFPEAMNVDFIEDSSPEFVYMYVEYDPS
jgi:hypothetical protein